MEHPKRILLTACLLNEATTVPNETKLALWLQVSVDVLTHSILISMKDKPRVLYQREKSEAK